jgi:hypothetical protein
MKSRPQRKDGGMKCGYPKGQWPHCCICDGRMHLPGCTSRMNKQKDCCPERHKMLYDAGQVRGLTDDSMAMWSETEHQGYHDPKR